MARDILRLRTFLLTFLITTLTATIAWAQVNPLISNVTAEEKLFVEYTATIFVEPLDGDGDFVEVDPDDLSVDLDGSPSGRVTITDFEPVAIRGRVVGYAAEMSTNEDQTISGTVELSGLRFSLGAFSTKFQEIGSISTVTTEVSNALADGDDEVVIRVQLIDDDRTAIEGVREEDFNFDFKALGPPQIESFNEDSEAAGFYYIGITNTESGSGSYELRVAGRFIGSASFTFDPVPTGTDPGNSIVTATSPHTADGEDFTTITVTLRDSDGSQLFEIPIDDITVSLSGNAEITGQAFDGEYFFQAVNNTAETVTVTVTVDDPIEGEVTLDDQPEIVFEAVDPVELVDQTRTIVEATSPHRPDGQDASTITVSLFDANNEPVDGVPENEIWLSYITGGSDFLSFSGFSSTGEIGVFEGELTNGQIATVEVAARINGEDSYDTATIAFQEDPVSASESEVTATSPHAADGEDTSVVTIKLFDDSGNPRMITSGMSFDFDISGNARMAGKIRADDSGSSQTGSLVGPPDSNETVLEIVNETEETVTVAVRVFDPNIDEWVNLDDIPEIEFISLPDPELSNVIRTSGSAIADGSDEIAVAFQLLDSSGQPINTVSSDEFEIDAGGSATESAVEIVDDNDGIYEFRLRNSTAETVGVAVTARSVLIDRIEVEFEEEPEPEDPVVDGSASGVSATSPHTADGSDASTVTVTVIGDDGNPMTGFSNSDFDIDLTGNAEASGVSHEGSGVYEFTVTNSTAQTVTVTVSVDGTELDETPQIVFEAEEPEDPVVDGSASGVSATSPHTADGSDASTVTVTVIGDDGNPMTGFSNSDFDIDLTGNAEASGVSHEGSGVYEFTVTNSTAQTVTVTVSVDGTELDETPQIVFEEVETVVPAPPVITDVITVDEGVRIEWESSSNNVDLFHVYRGSSPGDIELLTEIEGSSNSFTDSDIQDESNFYVVTALNAAGEESASSDAVNFFDGLILSNNSWQMVSKPLNGTVQLGSSITAFSFSDRYEIAESLNGTDGYWMKSNDDSSIEIEIRGEGVLETSISLNEGWNMIGGIAYNFPVSEIGDPAGVLTEAPVYYFEGGEYSVADELEPGKGYWVYAEEAGTIELSLHEVLASAAPNLFSVHQLIDGEHEELTALTVESADGRTQNIYLSDEVLSQRERYRYLLPPKAPEIFLDVRSATGYKVLQASGDSFTIEASEYPVNIRLSDQHGSEEYQLIVRDGNREEIVTIDGFRSYDLNVPADEILIKKVSETAESITEHKLLPNYPNPFNPSTTIQYQLSEGTHVTLEVFDASGRRVHVLADENQHAGKYSTSFNANNLASGLYVVRLRAGNQVHMQKISLIK
ncbi:MAG: T9SS C-terminal target domain-containing protein [Balneolaceae bacterium]|nr:MAG: T9SS C-terminal target domain-containing protein [Balneolaceae bacterium]